MTTTTHKTLPITLQKVLQFPHHTGLVLGTTTKQFVLYVAQEVATQIHDIVSDIKPVRPPTYMLVATLLRCNAMEIDNVAIIDEYDGVFRAALYLRGAPQQLFALDARPSDAIVLALLHKAPITCKATLLQRLPHYTDAL